MASLKVIYTVQIVLGVSVALLGLYLARQGALPIGPTSFPPDLSAGERLTFAFRCLAFSVLPMICAVGLVATMRGGNNWGTLGADPTTGTPANTTKAFKVRERILQNTLEQSFMHVFTVLALASCLDVDQLYVVPLMVLLFVVGRGAFFVGYMYKTTYRSFGFAMTFLPTIVGFLYALYTIGSRAML